MRGISRRGQSGTAAARGKHSASPRIVLPSSLPSSPFDPSLPIRSRPSLSPRHTLHTMVDMRYAYQFFYRASPVLTGEQPRRNMTSRAQGECTPVCTSCRDQTLKTLLTSIQAVDSAPAALSLVPTRHSGCIHSARPRINTDHIPGTLFGISTTCLLLS